jgi:hypothetical protein
MTEPTVTGPGYALLLARHVVCHKPAGKFWAADDIDTGQPIGQWERYPVDQGGCACQPPPTLPEGPDLSAAIREAKQKPKPEVFRSVQHSIPCW